MGNPGLKIDISEYGPLLEPGVVTELQNMWALLTVILIEYLLNNRAFFILIID